MSIAKYLLISICCGKQKPMMSSLRKQGSRAKKLDSRFRGNDKCCCGNSNYIEKFCYENCVKKRFNIKGTPKLGRTDLWVVLRF